MLCAKRPFSGRRKLQKRSEPDSFAGAQAPLNVDFRIWNGLTSPKMKLQGGNALLLMTISPKINGQLHNTSRNSSSGLRRFNNTLNAERSW